MRSDRGWEPGPEDAAWIEEALGDPPPAFLDIERAAEPGRVPILDRASGRLLSILAAGRRRIVEVGTAIGYSTAWLAVGQPADGSIVTLDPNMERTDQARGLWRRVGIPDGRITVVNRPALEAFDADPPIPELAGPFDLAFVDALKEEYLEYARRLGPRLAPDALLVADNVLWSGRVSGTRAATAGDHSDELRAFIHAIAGDASYRTTVLPIGDGLLVAARVPD